MKTMLMKRTISAVLAASMTIGLVGTVSAFADTEIGNTGDPTPLYLYYEDFESQTVDQAPTTIYSGTANDLYSADNKTQIESEYAAVKNESTTGIGNYLEINPYTSSNSADNSSGGAKVFLSEPMGKDDGTIVLEYDGVINLVNVQDSSKRLSVNKLITTKDGATRLETVQILNHKGVDRNNVMNGNNTHGFALTKYNPNADVTAGEASTTATGLVSYDGQSLMLRKNNEWNHYKFEFNLNDGAVTLWLNGKISETWINKTMFQIASGDKLESFILQSFNAASWTTKNTTPWKLDNIKIYKKDAEGVSPFENLTQDPVTGIVTATFKHQMSAEGIGLYDANGKDVTKTVTFAENKKSVSIKPSESTNGLYYVKVKKYDGGTDVAQGEKTIELNWTVVPGEYLYYEDFESQTVDQAPTTIYSGTANDLYSADNKTQIESEYAAVKNESTTGIGNYLEINPYTSSNSADNSSGGAKVFLSEPMGKDDGTIVLEYDGVINLVNVQDSSKRLSVNKLITTKDGATRLETVQILNHKGVDRNNVMNGNNTHGFALTKYNPNADVTAGEASTTATGLVSYDGQSLMLRKNNEWNHYKFEFNLNDGAVTLWLNGKISETWINKTMFQIASGDKLESFILQSFNAASWTTKNTTPWKLDNIKIYKKDADVTSPFSSDEITSKDGTVRFKTNFNVNKDDISIYNANGEKQNGEITVAEDGKSVQFVPGKVMKDGRYYIKLAKLASGDVTPQTDKEFDYKPGKTKTTISIGNITYTKGSKIKPTFNVEHNSGKSVTLRMIIAAYKNGRMIQAVTGDWGLDSEDYTGDISNTPEMTLNEDADTIKAFAWNLSNLAPTGFADIKTIISANE